MLAVSDSDIFRFVHRYHDRILLTIMRLVIVLCFLALLEVPNEQIYPSYLRARSSKNFLCHGTTRNSLLELQAVFILTPEEKQRLNSILTGSLTRKDVEIVISRYYEDITWSNMYSSIRTIYDKSGTRELMEFSKTEGCQTGKIISHANLGRETHTYLFHIVNNYHNLADVTVFCQGTKPTRGYYGHRVGGGHLIANSSFHDYVLSKTGHFVFTSAMWLPSIAHLVRKGYNSGRVPRNDAKKQCPTIPLHVPSALEAKFSFDQTPVLEHVAKLCAKENATWCSGPRFWKQFIKLPFPPNGVVYFAQGALFSVTAEKIRRRPLSDYQKLLEFASTSHDTSIGFFMEWFWYYLVTSDPSPCPTTGEEFKWAESLPDYEQLPFPDRVKAIYQAKNMTMPRKQNRFYSSPVEAFRDMNARGVKCPRSGRGSAAPLNQDDFDLKLKHALDLISQGSISQKGTWCSTLFLQQTKGRFVIYTTVNAEAAVQNLAPFLSSLNFVNPLLLSRLLIICFDHMARDECRRQLCNRFDLNSPDCSQCLHMDLGISNSSLAPGFSDKADADYWRLTYGRVYASLKIHEMGMSLLALDVDTIFLRNPFAEDGALGVNPDKIGVVMDAVPFDVDANDNALINGGFLYFPATTESSTQASRKILKKVWSFSCIHGMNEQIVTSLVLRGLARAAKDAGMHFDVMVLPNDQYLSYCNNNCGTNEFKSVDSLADLLAIESNLTGTVPFQRCEVQSRLKWVFFHTACIKWPNETKVAIVFTPASLNEC